MKPPMPEVEMPVRIDRVETAGFLSDLAALTKARLSTLVLVTTFVGYLAAAGSSPDWVAVLHVLIGTGLVAAGASVINQAMERDTDARMERTKDRPLPGGRIAPGTAWALGLGFSGAGLVYLALLSGAMAAAVAGLTLLVYAAIYTPMKRLSSLCTPVGAVSGALPPVIGWVAAGGALDAMAATLLGILFFWQLPHFLAINWMYREEYEKAGFVMWSNGDVSGGKTARLAVLFSALLLAVSAAPTLLGAATLWYLAGALLLGAVMLWLAFQFLAERTRPRARALFFWSIFYLPLLLGLLVFGRAS